MRVNEETKRMLQRKKGGEDDGDGPGRKVSETCAYSSVADMPAPRDLAIQVGPGPSLACWPACLVPLPSRYFQPNTAEQCWHKTAPSVVLPWLDSRASPDLT